MAVTYKDNTCGSLFLISPSLCRCYHCVSTTVFTPCNFQCHRSYIIDLSVWLFVSCLMIPLSILTDLFNCIPLDSQNFVCILQCVWRNPALAFQMHPSLPKWCRWGSCWSQTQISPQPASIIHYSSSIVYRNHQYHCITLCPSVSWYYIQIGWFCSTWFMSSVDVEGECGGAARPLFSQA